MHPPGIGAFASTQFHGIRNLKKLAFCNGLIGMAFENEPVASNVPVLFVVQMIGTDRLVVVSHV